MVFLKYSVACNYHEHRVGYTCGLTATVTFSHPENVDVIIEGTHLSGKSDDDVVFIIPEEAFLDFIPTSIIAKFKNLVEVDFVNVGLKRITTNTFSQAVNLKKIWLQNNLIPDLPQNAFVNTQIDYLHLLNNEIAELSWNSLAGLTQLDFLYLARNRIQGSLDPRLFVDLINLRTLHLSYNLITDIPANIFKNCAQLQFLSFGSNRIIMLKADSFNNLKSLTHLHLFNNGLRHIERNMFDSLQTLTEVHFRNNACVNFDLSDIINVDLEILPRLEPCFEEEVKTCLAYCTIADEL